nr:glycoside hydrolase family protein [Arsenophonus nasoniae]
MTQKLNANDRKGACDEMRRWVHVDGRKWKGLMNRRK